MEEITCVIAMENPIKTVNSIINAVGIFSIAGVESF